MDCGYVKRDYQIEQGLAMNYKNILFVCTGNICRSPMAKAIFEDMVVKSPELRSAGTAVKSAGTLNMEHHEASDKAIQVMKERGLDITSHRSRYIDQDLVGWSDIILVMEDDHREYILDQFTHAQNKVQMLTEFAGEKGDVPDPIGQGIEVYRQCAEQLTSLLRAISEKMAKGLVRE